jgi:glucose-6-phosphate dehydrogenase assembly protein OpcA
MSSSGTQARLVGMQPVALDNIEQQLDDLWRETNAGVAAGTGAAVARNAVLTLVAVTHDPSEARQALDIIHGLSLVHPSRAIVVAADGAAGPALPGAPPPDAAEPENIGIHAYVGSFTGPNNCYGEDILLTARGAAARHLPGVILPLIVTGLPAALWWVGEPPWGSEMLEALVDGSDRLIVDTSMMAHPERSMRALEDLMRRKSPRTAVGDTSWTVEAPWRDIVAQFFDASDVRPYLDDVARVTIEYAAGEENAPVNSSQAYLFAGWLASRLGWRINLAEPAGGIGSRQHTLRDGSGHDVTLEVNARYGVPLMRTLAEYQGYTGIGEFSPADSSTPHGEAGPTSATPPGHNGGRAKAVRNGALMSVYLAARNDSQLATFAVARGSDLAHATTACKVPGIALPSQTVHLRSLGESEPLADQLANLGHDPVYEEALVAASLLIGTSGPRSLP